MTTSTNNIPAEPSSTPPSIWNILKKSKIITLGSALVITCLLCAGSIQVFLWYMDATLRTRPPPETVSHPSSPVKGEEEETTTEPTLFNHSLSSSSSLSPIPENDSLSELVSSEPCRFDEENLLVIPSPTPENIHSVIVEVRRVFFTSPYRRTVPVDSIAEEDVSKFAYRNLLAIRQVFLAALLRYHLRPAIAKIITRHVRDIQGFIVKNIDLIGKPRCILTTGDNRFYTFPTELDEFTDSFVSSDARQLFHQTFLLYQQRWNREIIPLLLNTMTDLRALNFAFNSVLKGQFEGIHSAVTLPTLPTIHTPFIDPVYWLSENEVIIQCARVRELIPTANDPLIDYELTPRQQLDYLIALYNSLDFDDKIFIEH